MYVMRCFTCMLEKQEWNADVSHLSYCIFSVYYLILVSCLFLKKFSMSEVHHKENVLYFSIYAPYTSGYLPNLVKA